MNHDIVLRAPGIALVPLGPEHAAPLLGLVDDDLWAGMGALRPRTVMDMELAVLRAWESPGRYAFAVLDAESGEVRGSTSLHEVELDHRRGVVGHTFYGRPWWGGPTNPACKLALLEHAFDVWGLHRVALRVDVHNHRSIAAVERLGAVREGVLRGHRTTADGLQADSVSFSVLADEWPAVRQGLEARLGPHRGTEPVPHGPGVAAGGAEGRHAVPA